VFCINGCSDGSNGTSGKRETREEEERRRGGGEEGVRGVKEIELDLFHSSTAAVCLSESNTQSSPVSC